VEGALKGVGLLEAESSLIQPAGDTSLRGVKMALLRPSMSESQMIAALSMSTSSGR
jgi:hypothetical protein